MTGEAREAVTRVRPETRSSPDAPPPAPPRELDVQSGICVPFDHEGEAWVARAAGKGAGGTGSYGLAMMEAVHFCRAADAATPLYETLLAAGSLSGLYVEELRTLLSRAKRVVTLEEARAAAESRAGRNLRDR